MEDERTEFISERRETYMDEIEPWGSVEIEELPGTTVYANKGGGQWQAHGVDRMQALHRLERRMTHLDPFEQSDAGPPGEATGDPLSEAIPKETRQRMRDYQSLIDPNLLLDDE